MPLNTGIALVLPAPYIVQALTDPRIIEMRKAATRRARKRSGYTPHSAIHVAGDEIAPEANPGEERPDHREAFNRLVSAASKPKPKGGRT
jgi:hypothetical protein